VTVALHLLRRLLRGATDDRPDAAGADTLE
jgi:hypothetical protein